MVSTTTTVAVEERFWPSHNNHKLQESSSLLKRNAALDKLECILALQHFCANFRFCNIVGFEILRTVEEYGIPHSILH